MSTTVKKFNGKKALTVAAVLGTLAVMVFGVIYLDSTMGDDFDTKINAVARMVDGGHLQPPSNG